MNTPPPDLVVLVPARNEAEALGGVLAALRTAVPEAEVLVIDDASTDGTAAVAEAVGVRVLRHNEPRGYGAAIRSGLQSTSARRVALIDADGSYDARDLPALVAACPPDGMAVGARDREPAGVRRILKQLVRGAVLRLCGLDVPDLNSGLRVFDRSLSTRLANVLPDRFSLTTTLTLGGLALGATVRFVPVSYGPRAGGTSKFGPGDAFRFLRTALRGCGWIRDGRVAPASAPAVRGTLSLIALVAGLTLVVLAGTRLQGGLAVAVGLGLLAYPLFLAAKVARWRGLLAGLGVHLGFREAWDAYVAGMAFGAVTPGRLGEVARIVAPARRGHSVVALARATAVDRLLDLAVLATVGALALAVTLGAGAGAGAALAVACLGGVALLLDPVVERLAARFQARTGLAPGSPTPAPPGPAPGSPTPAPPGPGLLPLALRGLGYTIVSMGLFFGVAGLLLAQAGAEAPIGLLLAALASGNLAALLPASVGGAGTREAAVLGVLAAAGAHVEPAVVAAYGLAFHLVFTATPWALFVASVLRTAPPLPDLAPTLSRSGAP